LRRHVRRKPVRQADTLTAATFSGRAVIVTAAVLIAIAACLIAWPQDHQLLAQDTAPQKSASPGGFGAFTPQAFLKASRPFSPDGVDQAKKSWKPIERDADGVPTVLRCTGSPTGYLKTRQTYKEFRLSFQWRYPNNVNGNSGVLMHTTGPDKIWPRSIQVQLHAPKAGSVLTHNGAKTDNMVSVNDLVTNPKMWNTCVVTCRGSALTVEINGKKAGSVTGCVPSSGHLALQSEGSEVHFRNIRVERLKKPATKAGN